MPSTIRNIISAKEARKIIDHLTSWKGKVSDKWKVRATANQAALDKGDPFGYAEVVKELSVLQQQTPLSSTDRKHLNLGIEFLCEELADALGKTQDRVRQLIDKATSLQAATA